MVDSPDVVDPKQLEDLHIKVDVPEDELPDETRPVAEQP
jgi:hypothetical protein